MRSAYTIGSLAKAADVPVSTLRYYERAGLLKPDSRSPHGYRQYGRTSLESLRFIRTAQAAGFSLDDIKSLMRLRDHDQPPCEYVRDLIDSRLEDVERQLADLRHVQAVLCDARERCKAGEANKTCAVLDQFDAAAEKPSTPSS